MTTRNRSAYWDNIKGILIILTVFAHCLYSLQGGSLLIDALVDGIYMFHMPAFIFVSGYFSLSPNARSTKSLLRLGFLYILFQSAFGFYYGFSSLLTPLASYWYLLAMMVWRQTVGLISRFRYAIPCLILLSILVGFFPSIDNTLAIGRIIAFYPYFIGGYCFAKKQAQQENTKSRKWVGALAFLAMCGLMCHADRLFSYTDQALVMRPYAQPTDALGRCLLMLTATLAIVVFTSLTPKRSLGPLTVFGRNSLWIFLFHRPITILVSEKMLLMSDTKQLLIAGGLTLLLCLCFGNDFIARPLNRYADSAAELLSGQTASKATAVKITLFLIAVGYLLIIISSIYFYYVPAHPRINPFLFAFRKT